MVKSYTTPEDCFNDLKINHNPNNIKKIDDAIWNNACIEGVKCLDCKGPYETPWKKCWKEGLCKFSFHWQYNGTNSKPYICVETKGRGVDDLFIYMRRWLLNYCYEHKLEYIFRTCNNNGLCGHHINRNSFDDALKNIKMCLIPDHTTRHSKVKKIEFEIYQLNKQLDTLKLSDEEKFQRYVRIQECNSEIYNIFNNFPSTEERLQEIHKGIQLNISRGTIYQCPSSWKRKYTPPTKGTVVRTNSTTRKKIEESYNDHK